MSTTTAIAMARALRRHGVAAAFAQSLPSQLLLAAENEGIRQVSYRTENAGGAMADGYARIAGRVGIVAAQNGPAAALLVAPLAEAQKASVPVLALVQDVSRAHRDRNAFQELDHFELFRSCAKWVRRLDDPDRVDDYLDMAMTAACSGRPGPAVLLLPRDLLGEPASESAARVASLGAYPAGRSRPAGDRVRAAAELLAEARSPLVVAGGGVHLSGAAAALAELQELASVPVATTNMGKGAVAETRALSLGVIGNYMGPRGAGHRQREIVESADVVLLVGTRTNENGTDAWRLLPRSATFVHLDVDSNEIGRNYESIPLVGDARLGLEDLCEALRELDLTARGKARADLEAAIAEGRERHAGDISAVTGSGARPIRPERVMAELDQILTPDSVVVADASYATIWMCNYLQARHPGQRFLSPRGLAGLGWGLPMALGAKVARPEAPVFCISGDGGFGHVWAEIETAVRERLGVTIVLLNNGVLGFQKHSELIQYGRHTSAIDFAPVDHAAIARECGAVGVRVEDPSDLAELLRDGRESDRPTLLEVMTDPDAYPPITDWDGKMDAVLDAERIAQGS